MIPLSTDRPIRRTPVVNTTIIVVNVLIALFVAASPEFSLWVQQNLVLYPRAQHVQVGQAVVEVGPGLSQFITYQFLHAGFMHLAGNMIFLWVFGNVVEDRFGHFWYACFYLGGGVVAGVAHAVFFPNSVVGASGAVAAVAGAFLALFPLTHIRILWFFIVITIIQIPSMWFIAFNIARDIFGQLTGRPGVAYLAHLAGYAYGLSIGLGLLALRILPREPYDLFSMLNQWNRRRRFRSVTRQHDPWTGRQAKRTGAFAEPQPRNAKTKRNRSRADSSPPDESAPSEADERLARERGRIAELLAKGEAEEAVDAFLALRREHSNLVLGAPNQLDLANHLYGRGEHEAALSCYEALLKTYPTADHSGQVRLMIGLTLTRYLNRASEAREVLREAVEKLAPGPDRDLARELLHEAGGG